MRSSTGQPETLWVPNRQFREPRNQTNKQTSKKPLQLKGSRDLFFSKTPITMCLGGAQRSAPLPEGHWAWTAGPSAVTAGPWERDTSKGAYSGSRWGTATFALSPTRPFPILFCLSVQILAMCWFQTPKMTRIVLTSRNPLKIHCTKLRYLRNMRKQVP